MLRVFQAYCHVCKKTVQAVQGEEGQAGFRSGIARCPIYLHEIEVDQHSVAAALEVQKELQDARIRSGRIYPDGTPRIFLVHNED